MASQVVHAFSELQAAQLSPHDTQVSFRANEPLGQLDAQAPSKSFMPLSHTKHLSADSQVAHPAPHAVQVPLLLKVPLGQLLTQVEL